MSAADRAEAARRDLKRLLANGRLTMIPKRPSDQERSSSGSTYRVNEARAADLDAVRAIDPAAITADIQAERSRRKQQRAS
jgi:hypothetical protein